MNSIAPLRSLFKLSCLAVFGLNLMLHSAQAEIDQRQQESLLRQLVEINSGSKNTAGVTQVQKLVAEKLEALGFKSNWITPENNAQGGSLLLSEFLVPENDKSFLTLVVHADTVFESESGFLKYEVDGDTGRGPGVIDNKGGIVVMLSALEDTLAKMKNSLKLSIRVLVSPSEELGSGNFISAFEKVSRESALVLGVEPSNDDGAIISSRRGNRWYEISVVGREAHAGRAHKHGANACVELSEKLVRIAKLTNYSKNFTVSVGHIEGGQDKFNVVCGTAKAKVDMRFADLNSRDQAHKQIEGILAKSYVTAVDDQFKTQTTYKIVDDSKPVPETKASLALIKIHDKISLSIEGKSAGAKMSGGAGDVNLLSRSGLTILDGLGPVGGKMHTKEEWIQLSSLRSRAQILSELLQNQLTKK